MAEPEFIKLNMAIRPPESSFRVARKFSNQLPGGNKVFTLDEIRIPHITIYYAEFPTKNLQAIIDEVSEICKSTEPFKVEFDQTDFRSNYFFAIFKRTREILDFHNKFLKQINPFREGHLKEKYTPGSPELEKFSAEEQKNAVNYGHFNTGSTFFPHISLTYYEGKLPKLADMPKVFFDTFTAEKLIIFTGGENGTSEKVVKEFKLTGNS